MQRNRGKQQNRKDSRSLQENWSYQGNISCKDGLNKGHKWQGPNRSRRELKKGGKNTQKNCVCLTDPDNHKKRCLNDQITTTAQEMILQMDITRWSIPKSD